jgi:hypothetical protein
LGFLFICDLSLFATTIIMPWFSAMRVGVPALTVVGYAENDNNMSPETLNLRGSSFKS